MEHPLGQGLPERRTQQDFQAQDRRKFMVLISLPKSTLVAFCLAALAVSLLFVGIVSGSPIRHAIQIVPVVLTILIVLQRNPWGLAGALAIFFFWLVKVISGWLFVSDVTRILRGRFSLVEIVLTLTIAASSVWGLRASWHVSRKMSVSSRLVAFLLFLALQWMFFRLSQHTFVTYR
jgi:hypothetical protein